LTPNNKELDYDVMIVGAGVAGMETAASLGDMGYRVLLVEKNSSIGGKSILLSKVFPTLDCASCIVTPKMAAAAHHSNIEPFVFTEVDSISRNDDGTFAVDLHKKASYVDFDACTGCGQCKKVCPVNAISGPAKSPHRIDREPCTRCGACRNVCPAEAVVSL
jgi:heterodisulfide reductase subunit A-like polyferredoxin